MINWFLALLFGKENISEIYQIEKPFLENIEDMRKLSIHLSLSEGIKSVTAKRHGIANIPSSRQLKVMRHLAREFFEPLRSGLGNYPIIINSFYRSQELNTILNGARNSDHMIEGDTAAIDIDNDSISLQTGISNSDIFYYVFDNMDYYKLIWEFGDEDSPSWVHISFSTSERNNKKKLTSQAVLREGKVFYKEFKDKR